MAILIPTTITVTLDNDQIKALPTTTFELVPTPGANKMLVFLHGIARSHFSAGAYGDVNGSAFAEIDYNDGDESASNKIAAATFFGLDTDAIILTFLPRVHTPNPNDAGQGLAGYALSSTWAIDKNIRLYVGNSGAAFTLGHADNTLDVTVVYFVQDV